MAPYATNPSEPTACKDWPVWVVKSLMNLLLGMTAKHYESCRTDIHTQTASC